MAWHWLALARGEPPAGALAAAPVRDGAGHDLGVLAAWPAAMRPAVPAAKIDVNAIDPGGPPAVVSLVLLPSRLRILFDDLAVQGARRAVLAASRPPLLVATLVRGDSLFAGALTVLDPGAPYADPFARIHPARLLEVGPGVLASGLPAPAGPVIERYGSGNPWPADRFDPVASGA